MLNARRRFLGARRLRLWTGVLSLLGLALVGGCATVPEVRTADHAVRESADSSVTGLEHDRPIAADRSTVNHSAKASTAHGAGAAASARAVGPGSWIGLDPLNPTDAYRFNEEEARRDLWQRIRESFSVQDLQNQALVDSTIQWYAARPDYVQRMTERGGRYLFHIIEEVQRRQLPSELALLPFIESAFNPQALSVAKASGMWQFMPATGRDFSLRQNVFRDDRRDVLASTRAALDYLTRLHAQFGHWHLALAAYNWGEGNVQRAIARNQRAGLPTDYESLRMPDETRRYVPKLLAVKALIADPARFGLTLPPLENHPYFLSVPIERDMDVKVAASLAGLDVSEFEALNPQQNKPVILAAGTPRILLPYDNAERFLKAVERHEGPWASWTAWQAPRTVRVAEAARMIGMPESELRGLNRIPAGMMIRQGSTLLVPRARDQDDVSERVADTATIELQREPVPKRAQKAGSKGSQKSRAPTALAKAPSGKAPTSRVATATKPTGKPALTTRVAAGPKSTRTR